MKSKTKELEDEIEDMKNNLKKDNLDVPRKDYVETLMIKEAELKGRKDKEKEMIKKIKLFFKSWKDSESRTEEDLINTLLSK